MDKRFTLKAVDESLKVKVFKIVYASDGLQHATPFWH
jgi:hypothetical protein